MTVYERIKYLRLREGLSQQQLAEKVGYKTASAINKIELGLRDINQSQVITFAQALNITPAYLMGWENDYNKNKPVSEEKRAYIEKIENMDNEQFNRFVQILELFEQNYKNR